MTVAALFVRDHGHYHALDGIETWPKGRDARRYHGPHPVVAHPPCERWGKYYSDSLHGRDLKLGDDGGCFVSAVHSVRIFGGVLEHPANSKAWELLGWNKPPASGGWVNADFNGGWTCHIEQGNYGHRARKPTWLFASGFVPPPLIWGESRAVNTVENMGKAERETTPIALAKVLADLARLAA